MLNVTAMASGTKQAMVRIATRCQPEVRSRPSKNGAPAAASDKKSSRVLVTLKSAKKWPSTIKLPRENVMTPAAPGHLSLDYSQDKYC